MLPTNERTGMRADRGFTLVELLVAMFIAAIVVALGYNLLSGQRALNQVQQNTLEMQSNARAAIQILLQEFSHAGFGCSENISSTNKVGNQTAFVDAHDNTFNGLTPDSVTLVYGSEVVAVATADITTDSNVLTVDDASDVGTSTYEKYISIYPSLEPNSFYEVTSTTGTTIDIDRNVSHVDTGAKVFRVTPILFYVLNNELRQKEVEGTRDDIIVANVQDFQIAYTTAESNLETAVWENNPTHPENVTAVWIYLLFRTRGKDPGFQENRTFRLPWNAGSTASGATLPSGYHYLEFQTKVWLRNAS